MRATEGELRTDLMPPNTVYTHTHTRINSYPAHRTVGVAHTDVLKQLLEEWDRDKLGAVRSHLPTAETPFKSSGVLGWEIDAPNISRKTCPWLQVVRSSFFPYVFNSNFICLWGCSMFDICSYSEASKSILQTAINSLFSFFWPKFALGDFLKSIHYYRP